MPTTARVPKALSALTPSQLKAVEVAIKYSLRFDISQMVNWRMEWESTHSTIVWPTERTSASEEFSLALTGKKWSLSSAQQSRFAFSLLKKGVLTELAVIEPEHTDERTKRSYRKSRYTISNEVREASGSVAVALDQLRAKEEASVARQDAWNAARAPLDQEARSLTDRGNTIRQSLYLQVQEPTADELVESHWEYHELVAKLENLNTRLKALAAEHNRKYEPYTLRGW